MPEGTIDGSYGNCIFSFIGNCQRGCIVLHPHQQYMSDPVFYILASIWCCHYYYFKKKFLAVLRGV